MTLQLSLSVQDGFKFPKENDLFSREVAAMTTRLEETQTYTEEDQLIVHTLAGDFQVDQTVNARNWWRETLAKLSTEFPNLIFALDVKSTYTGAGPHGDAELVRREYFRDGNLQVAMPQVLVPDYDEDADGEQLVPSNR